MQILFWYDYALCIIAFFSLNLFVVFIKKRLLGYFEFFKTNIRPKPIIGNINETDEYR
jgi:hypothetical protein